MPRFEFWHSPSESTGWSLPTAPAVGDERVVGDHLVRVLGTLTAMTPNVLAEYEVERLRPATEAEQQQAAAALHELVLTEGGITPDKG